MLFSESAAEPRRQPVAAKIASLVRESWWLALVALALYLALILLTFDKSNLAGRIA